MTMPVATITSMHVCPMVTVLVPHVGGPVVTPGAPTVLCGVLPVACVGSICVCVGPPDTIVKGSATVLASNKPLARLGDSCSHGGTIVVGVPVVLAGG